MEKCKRKRSIRIPFMHRRLSVGNLLTFVTHRTNNVGNTKLFVVVLFKWILNIGKRNTFPISTAKWQMPCLKIDLSVSGWFYCFSPENELILMWNRVPQFWIHLFTICRSFGKAFCFACFRLINGHQTVYEPVISWMFKRNMHWFRWFIRVYTVRCTRTFFECNAGKLMYASCTVFEVFQFHADGFDVSCICLNDSVLPKGIPIVSVCTGAHFYLAYDLSPFWISSFEQNVVCVLIIMSFAWFFQYLTQTIRNSHPPSINFVLIKVRCSPGTRSTFAISYSILILNEMPCTPSIRTTTFWYTLIHMHEIQLINCAIHRMLNLLFGECLCKICAHFVIFAF